MREIFRAITSSYQRVCVQPVVDENAVEGLSDARVHEEGACEGKMRCNDCELSMIYLPSISVFSHSLLTNL